MRPEEGVGFAGGGFSNYFPRPPYQKDYVPAFLGKLGTENAGLYKFVFCRDLTRPMLNFVIYAALMAAEFPTSPLRRATTCILSTPIPLK
jgi:hypothetical protein